MMERHQHNNLWAEKLSQVSLPDSRAAWLTMEALLDKEMPTGWRRYRRRWLLLILLLLLLIGVCNCPGSGRFSAVTARWRWPKAFQTVTVGDKIARGPSPGGTPASRGTTSTTGNHSTEASGGETSPPGANSPLPGNAAPAAGNTPPVGRNASPVAGNTPPVGGNPSNAALGVTPAGGTSPTIPTTAATHSRYTPAASVKHRRLHSGPKDATGGSPETGSPGGAPKAASPGAGSPGAGSPEGASPGAGSPAKRASAPAGGLADSSVRAIPEKKNSLATPVRKPVAKDSTHKKPATAPVEQPKKEKDNGWMVGIGLNQFFAVGGQQTSSWNSSGITGTLSDYIPVPMIRYYFNAKLYVQLEAQINTPQDTKKNLVISETPADSSSPARFVESSVSINKLFYFNLPLSVHYTVAKNLNLGTGLQYSQLTNGIGVFSSTYSTSTVADSIASQTKSFKGNPLYQELKTHELRWLLDANYTYKHFIFGLRYNQALSKYINVQVSSTQVTQARNSSLQLYLRYILWDGRKKKPPLTTK